jgi:hypothetical protein
MKDFLAMSDGDKVEAQRFYRDMEECPRGASTRTSSCASRHYPPRSQHEARMPGIN